MTQPRHDLYVGCDVQCINDQVPLANGATVKDANITEGQVYKIRWLGMAHLYTVGDYLGVKLESVDSRFGEANGVPDAPYDARRFRPLVSDPLSIFRAIAADPHGPVRAPDGPVRVREKEEVE